jgi:PAS domain S-box-containing protein
MSAANLASDDPRLKEVAERILQCLPGAVLVVDSAGVVTVANGEAERLFVYLPGQLTGNALHQLLPGVPSGSSSSAAGDSGMAARAAGVTKRQAWRRDGTTFTAEVSVKPLKTDDGWLDVVAVHDVSAAERAETDRTRLMRERALHEDANRLKDEFLAVLSHELRTPMNSIIGWTSVLRSSVQENPETVRALDIIQRNARTLVRLIEDLLDVSRIVSGHLRIDLRRVDLVTITAGVVDNMRVTAEAKNLALTFTPRSAALPVIGDPDRLQQVVWNLVSNAVKFTPTTGTIDVVVEREQDSAYLRVRDTGTGIASEFLPHVFDRFRRADSSSTRSQSGLGLGLAIVRSVVQLHRGTVTAESPGSGHGSTFTVELPIAPDEPST